MSDLKFLFFGKEKDSFVQSATHHLRKTFDKVNVFIGNRSQSLPVGKDIEECDWVISYLCPWVLPGWLLKKARKGAINFHPGPPEYPGIGCTNFAIYYNEHQYGVTCHFMARHVDTGPIVKCVRFPLSETDSVYSLTQRCYEHIYQLFLEIFGLIVEGKELPLSQEIWKRRPFTRAELNALCEVTPEMDAEEVQRRVRATAFPGMPGAFVILGGERFLSEKSLKAETEP